MSQAVNSNSQSFVQAGEKALEQAGNTLGNLASRFSLVSTVAKFGLGAAVTVITKPEQFKEEALELVTSTARAIGGRVEKFVSDGLEADRKARGALVEEIKTDIGQDLQLVRNGLVNAALSLQTGELEINGKPVLGAIRAIEKSNLTQADKQQLTSLYSKELSSIRSETEARISDLHGQDHPSRTDYVQLRSAIQKDFGEQLAKLSADAGEVIGSISSTTVKQGRRLAYAQQDDVPDHKSQIARAWNEARRAETYDMPAYGRVGA
ncbi:MAG: hypothetical protein KME15_16370 [Drouetiella hepatica Uher 2000/2452]|jgi:hypothetical protein|uniref:Uncharacterized protein n=1 Tax=Drouetiella hepatica Uher 2000/2452 TaxID=904376 RepID=A0A951QCK6_9CYAN|nr:hypothetical protein [Drouetiella hepatica Uher 2000/2452]